MSQDFLRSHEEIEEVIEYYLKDCNALLEKTNYLVVTIQNAEDLVRRKMMCMSYLITIYFNIDIIFFCIIDDII